MKRNTFYTSAILLSALALSACSNEAEESINAEQSNAPQEITLRASIGSDTRTYVHDEGSGNSYKTNWNEGDQIYVWGYELDASSNTEKPAFPPYVYGKLTTSSPANNSADFTGFLWGAGTRENLKYALSPAPERTAQDHKTFFYTLKSSYKYEAGAEGETSDFTEGGAGSKEAITNAPMSYIQDASGSEFSNITFQQLTGMVRVQLDGTKLGTLNIAESPTNGEKITVTVYASEDIAGTAKVTLDETDGNKNFNLVMDNEVSGMYTSVTFTNIEPNQLSSTGGSSNPLALDFPVPAGKNITYTICMTYPKTNATGSGDPEIVKEKKIYVATKTIDKGQLWIPIINEESIQATTGEWTNI